MVGCYSKTHRMLGLLTEGADLNSCQSIVISSISHDSPEYQIAAKIDSSEYQVTAKIDSPEYQITAKIDSPKYQIMPK